ncbi:MAG: hypothetical protein IKH16_12675 [Selenomonadaceae bacterium]|nr:hypothetical protein [Selenomonadaceae bacterium]MBR4695088.1 hypothetical protein [Selenomonadaceae bacterium]
MKFERKKVENCFADSRTYEYRVPVSARELEESLPEPWETRRNEKLRRPVFIAEKEGIRLKGILAGNTVRASFLETEWERRQREFEEWLERLGECRGL